MADIIGKAEKITCGQDLIIARRSSWKEGFVAKATRATYSTKRNKKL